MLKVALHIVQAVVRDVRQEAASMLTAGIEIAGQRLSERTREKPTGIGTTSKWAPESSSKRAQI